MNHSTRLITIVLFNIVATGLMLYWLNKSGVDITHSTIADNAENVGFIFDLLSFIGVSFVVNVGILSYPSKKKMTIDDVIKIIDIKNVVTPSPKHRRQIV